MAAATEKSEFPGLPPLDELFTTHAYEELFPVSMSEEQRKRIRRLLWDGVEELLRTQEVLKGQIQSQREELRETGEEKDFVVAEVGKLRGELKELQASVYTDKLTGLLNSHGFEQEYSDWLKANEDNPDMKFTFLYIDVDNLKMINDTYTHRGGDVAIAYFADALRRVSREGDIVARMHGDEFVLGLPSVRSPAEQSGYEVDDDSTFGIEEYVQKLPARITKWLELSIDDKGVPEGMIMDMIEALRTIQFSYGAKICSGEDFKRPISDLLHAADEQMYIHKRRTKARKTGYKIVQFSHKSLEDSQERYEQCSVITALEC